MQGEMVFRNHHAGIQYGCLKSHRDRKTSDGVKHFFSPERNGPQHSPCVLPDPQGQSTSLALSGVRVFIFAKTSSSFGGGAPNPLVVRAIPFFFLLPPLAASAVVGLAPTAALGLLVMMLNPVVNPSRVRKRIVDIACIMRATFTSIMFVALPDR